MARALQYRMTLGLAALLVAGCGGGGSDVGICAGTFAACGGDPTGKWQVSDLCLGRDLAQLLNDSLGASSPACMGAVQSATLRTSGTIAYNAGTVTYDTVVSTTTRTSYTVACMNALMPSVPADATSCAKLGPQPGAADETGSCSFSGSACNCDVDGTSRDTSVNSYAVSGATITESGGASYEFCVSGLTMTQRGALASTSYGTMTLTRQ